MKLLKNKHLRKTAAKINIISLDNQGVMLLDFTRHSWRSISLVVLSIGENMKSRKIEKKENSKKKYEAPTLQKHQKLSDASEGIVSPT